MAGIRKHQLPGPTFTTKEALASGLHPRDLYRMRDDGSVLELSRGVYRSADAPATPYLDLLAIAHRVPTAVVCMLSAAAIHELTDQVPSAVQIAVPRGQRPPQLDYPPVEVSRYDASTFDLGRDTFEAAPAEPVSIYDAPRTVVDLMRARHRLGDAVALRALRLHVTGPGGSPAKLLDYARSLGVEGPVRAALDAVTS